MPAEALTYKAQTGLTFDQARKLNEHQTTPATVDVAAQYNPHASLDECAHRINVDSHALCYKTYQSLKNEISALKTNL